MVVTPESSDNFFKKEEKLIGDIYENIRGLYSLHSSYEQEDPNEIPYGEDQWFERFDTLCDELKETNNQLQQFKRRN